VSDEEIPVPPDSALPDGSYGPLVWSSVRQTDSDGIVVGWVFGDDE
jgi:hypothetical protein